MKGSTRYKIIVYVLVTIVFFVSGLRGYFSFSSEFAMPGTLESGYPFLLNAVVAVCVVASLFGISRIRAGRHPLPKIVMQLLSYAMLLVSLLIWTAIVCFHLLVAHKVDVGDFANFFAAQMAFSAFASVIMVILLKSISLPSRLGGK